MSERVNVYFVLLTIHHSSLVRTILFGFCIVFYAPIVPTKIKNTHKERKAHTTIWSTLSVLFHFLGLILKLYDRNFSAGQPINARVWKCECVRSSRMYALSACVCVTISHFMRNHEINRNWFVFRVQIKMAWKYIFHSLKSCSRNPIHAKPYHICIYYNSIITGGILFVGFFFLLFGLIYCYYWGSSWTKNERLLMVKYILQIIIVRGSCEKITTEHNTVMKCFACTISELNVIKI